MTGTACLKNPLGIPWEKYRDPSRENFRKVDREFVVEDKILVYSFLIKVISVIGTDYENSN